MFTPERDDRCEHDGVCIKIPLGTSWASHQTDPPPLPLGVPAKIVPQCPPSVGHDVWGRVRARTGNRDDRGTNSAENESDACTCNSTPAPCRRWTELSCTCALLHLRKRRLNALPLAAHHWRLLQPYWLYYYYCIVIIGRATAFNTAVLAEQRHFTRHAWWTVDGSSRCYTELGQFTWQSFRIEGAGFRF